MFSYVEKRFCDIRKCDFTTEATCLSSGIHKTSCGTGRAQRVLQLPGILQNDDVCIANIQLSAWNLCLCAQCWRSSWIMVQAQGTGRIFGAVLFIELIANLDAGILPVRCLSLYATECVLTLSVLVTPGHAHPCKEPL